MTAREVIRRLDDRRPNELTLQDKLAALDEMEGSLYRSLFAGEDRPTVGEDTELVARGFEGMYYARLCEMLDYEAGDAARQAHDAAICGEIRREYAEYIVRNRNSGGVLKVGDGA